MEVQTLLDWQAKRTPEEVERCKAEEGVTVFAFADVLEEIFAKTHAGTAK